MGKGEQCVWLHMQVWRDMTAQPGSEHVLRSITAPSNPKRANLGRLQNAGLLVVQCSSGVDMDWEGLNR